MHDTDNLRTCLRAFVHLHLRAFAVCGNAMAGCQRNALSTLPHTHTSMTSVVCMCVFWRLALPACVMLLLCVAHPRTPGCAVAVTQQLPGQSMLLCPVLFFASPPPLFLYFVVLLLAFTSRPLDSTPLFPLTPLPRVLGLHGVFTCVHPLCRL